MKVYTISVTVKEGCDEFWESFAEETGCDVVVNEIKLTLAAAGFGEDDGCTVKLVEFKEIEE